MKLQPSSVGGLVLVASVLVAAWLLLVRRPSQRNEEHEEPASSVTESQHHEQIVRAPSGSARTVVPEAPAPDLDELRSVALELLRRFDIPSRMPLALGPRGLESARQALGVDAKLELLLSMDPDEGAAQLSGLLQRNGPLLTGSETQLVDGALRSGAWSWHAPVARHLAEQSTPAARKEASRLLGHEWEEALRTGLDVPITQAGSPPSPVWQVLWETIDLIGAASIPESAAVLAETSACLAQSEDRWEMGYAHPHQVARSAVLHLAAIPTDDATELLVDMLTSPSWKVRQTAADAGVAAIVDGRGSHLLGALTSWAEEVMSGAIVVPRQSVRLAWVVAAENGNAALPALLDVHPSRGDVFEYRAWSHAVVRAALTADPETGRRALRTYLSGDRAPTISVDSSGEVRKAAYSALAQLGHPEDWRWLSERALSSDEPAARFVLEGIPGELWEDHLYLFEPLLADLIKEWGSDAAIVRLALRKAARAGADLKPYLGHESARLARAAALAVVELEAASEEAEKQRFVAMAQGDEGIANLIREWHQNEAQRGLIEEVIRTAARSVGCQDLELQLQGESVPSELFAALSAGLVETESGARCVGALRSMLGATLESECERMQSRSAIEDALRTVTVLAVTGDLEERAVAAFVLDAWAVCDSWQAVHDRWDETVGVLRAFISDADLVGRESIL